MGELTCRLTVHAHALYSHALEKTRHDDAADRIDSIESYLEMSVSHGFHIHCRKSKDSIKMIICKISFLYITEAVNIRKVEILALSTFENGGTFLGIEEFAFLVEKFEGIPLLRIM